MNRQRIRHIALALAFLLVLLGLLTAASLAYRPRDNTKKGGMYYNEAHGYLAYPADEFDVFAFGCSNYYNGINPLSLWEQHGITCYDMCTGGQRVYEAYIHLREVLATHHPKVVLLDGYTVLREIDMDEALFSTASYYFPVFFYHNNWKTYDWDMLTAPVEYTNRNRNKGYRPGTKICKVEAGDYMAPTDERGEFPLMNRIYLRKIAQLCRENGVALVIAAMPAPAIWDYGCYSVLQQDAQSLGIPFLDLNLMLEELGIDFQTDFRDDGDHMNNTGAAKVTAYLGQVLSQEYGIADHRGDSAYAQWDEDLADSKA
jgi:hypothetical protein